MGSEIEKGEKQRQGKRVKFNTIVSHRFELRTANGLVSLNITVIELVYGL